MKYISWGLIFFTSIIFSCTTKEIPSLAIKDQPLISYVNPFIGTGGHGHTYPGASAPFGMMQLSPDTRLDGWDGCSGYHYSDEYIYGFSHTHLSGTGVSDYGDILLMPTNDIIFNNGANGQKGYRSRFSHQNEIAEPGYYKVHLDDTRIDVELTVAKRSGIHRYQFPSAEHQVVTIDLNHRDQVLSAGIRMISDHEISGHRHSKAWATHQKIFFYAKFSHPITGVLNHTVPKNNDRLASYVFVNPKNEPIIVKIGISAVNIEGAKKNLEAEIGDKSFNQAKKEVQESWEKQLEKIVVEDTNNDHKVNFYSALYHTMLAPNLYTDVDGRYRGMDLKIHEAKNFDYYTVFSLWDTYRATHPLYTIIEKERTNDFINTFLAKYEEGGIMPIWDLAACYTGCMIGYHAVPVIADAYLKGIRGFDTEKAFQAMKHSATRNHLGLQSYQKYGFIPVEKESESVSKTLEYAYDDWTISQMAKEMGKEEDYKSFSERAQYYKNIFDPQSRFMRGRFRNTWFSPFDPYEVNFNYTEANSWQYSFYVPQDITGFIELMGGKQVLENQLDALFTASRETSGRNQADITGLIGQYAHGNEPSHHIAYLYNFVNKPHKTQERVRQILTQLYTNAPDGISGNEDCGQMSAWYVFSAMGFYPVTPASNEYIIGSPLFDKATVHLENGKTFTITAENNSQENNYIKAAFLNGKQYPYTYIRHSDIVKGGSLVFEMTNKPTSWGSEDNNVPKTEIHEHQMVPTPFIARGDVTFKEQTVVTLASVDEEATIYYTLGDDIQKYSEPIVITKKSRLKVYAEKKGKKSATVITDFLKIDPNLRVELKTKYANQYNAGGDNALIDGIVGTEDFRTGTWQGYWDEDVVAIVDLGKNRKVNTVNVNFLVDQRSWIFLPTSVEILGSEDGVSYEKLGKENFKTTDPEENSYIKNFEIKDVSQNFRYIQLVARKLGKLPKWHLGHPHDGRSWIFVDEIRIR